MTTQFRFYSFVAGLYISPLQCGLQTAHTVSRMHADLLLDEEEHKSYKNQRHVFDEWAQYHQTIIICNALNSGGVEECHAKLQAFNSLGLPTTIFYEDQASLNCAATACAVVVPDHFYDAKPVKQKKLSRLSKFVNFMQARKAEDVAYRYTKEDGSTFNYLVGSVEAEFIKHIKQYRLA